ncbi:hypothetical protein DFR86_11750 [Acidianus sulfidivorans JP7]|uniref:Uncharacterized protein n=1 Tax=Acidianus sulfidivorans JP7 TaxID=619593 RepID=A0A2U9IJ71_9CREN|nr:hypothetical protein [Acidianus sulfidivorans]AWR98143.1 hypothetical protein DFR86_11750 [Acidianus sulfidivorans JP7]
MKRINRSKKGQALIIAFVIIVVLVIAAILPFLLVVNSSNYLNLQGAKSASVISNEKTLQVQEVESGDPYIFAGQNSNGNVYLKFVYVHGYTPLYVNYIYYFNGTGWQLAYPRGFGVITNTTLYLFTPIGYSGDIIVITNLNNEFIIPVQHSIGLETCANIYSLIITSAASSSPELICPSTTIPLTGNATIITPTDNALPKVATNENLILPKGTVIILPNGNEITLQNNATLELYSGDFLIQKCIESGYYPISSFLTGYQSDNDNIGTIDLEERNPELQAQTLVQWFIASGNIQPITICVNNGPTTPKANVSYLSTYAPQGGYVLWTGDAGLIVGDGIQIQHSSPPGPKPGPNPNPPGSNNNYYVAFTVQLSNGSWITIVDPNGFPVVGEENNQPSTALILAVGTYDPNTGQMSLYINGTLVSQVTLPAGIELNASLNSFMDVGSVYNGSGPASNGELKSIPGMEGDIADGGSPSYSFNGALGPTVVYNTSLTPYEVSEIYNGALPSPNNIVVLWTQNTAEEVCLNTKTGQTTPTYFTNQPGGPGPGNSNTLLSDAVEVYNLANPSEFNGFWGWAGAIPTAFAPFNDIVIWGGPGPIFFNPNIIEGEPINITFESQGELKPINPGSYIFSVNFTDYVPVAENALISGANALNYANEYAIVYINGKLVFEGKYVDNQLTVIYSNNQAFMQNNLPEFEYRLTGPVNITTVFIFNMENVNIGSTPPAIYFSLMWEPPGSSYFEYIPITNIVPFPNY